MQVEIIPSAKRLIKSLRDIGYEFEDAIADLIDNSIEAGSTVVKISLIFTSTFILLPFIIFLPD